MKKTLYLTILFYFCWLARSWCEKTHFAETSQINDIDISPDRTMVITSSNSKKMIVWNFTNLHPIFTLNCSNSVASSRFSKNQIYIAVGQSSTGSVNILQTSTFTSLRNISTGCGSVAEVDFSWDNARLLICGSSALEIYSTSTWARETQITGSTFTACKFQKNNKYAAGDSSGKTNVYLTVANTLEWSDSQGGSITSLDFDMVNYTLISTNGAGNKYNLYPSAKWPAGGTTQTLIKGVSVTNSANSVAFAKEGSIYAIGTSNNLLIYENSTNNNLFNWTTGSVVSGVFSYDSQYFIAGGSSGIAKVFKRMCQSCPSGTYQYSYMCVLCSSAMVGCLSCPNATYCTACGDGYAIDTVNNNCTLCHNTMPGCVLCNSTTICTSCSSQYYLLANNCSSCQNIANCLTCTSSTACAKCNSDFYLDATFKCTSCSTVANCQSCLNSTACISCLSGYYLSSNMTCTLCQQNCTQCYTATNCTQCVENFYLNSTNTCVGCSSNCLTCTSTTCTRCAISYYLNGTVCAPCSGPCSVCSSAVSCITCIAGYYQSAGSCIPCSANCLTCTSLISCLSCNINYFYQSGTNTCSKCQNLLARCLQCTSTTCLSCQSGYYFDGTNCLKCKQELGCQTCQNSTFCLSCLSEYQYTQSTGVCSTCGIGCSGCVASTCTSCLPKYYLSSGACSLCPYNCPTCLNATYCLYCLEGFYLNSTNNCSICSNAISNCVSCSSITYCTSCQLGYKLNAANTSCIKCSWPCALCNSTSCAQCASGYYLNAGVCSICTQSCSACNTLAICTSCVDGYYLSATSVCINCQSISSGCQICNSTYCLSCLSNLGYYLDSSTMLCGSCSVIPNCLNCNNNTICMLCSYGYYLSAGVCKLCSQAVSYCQQCNAGGTCQSCVDPYYLSGSVCQLCSEGCFSCSSGASCRQCYSGYLMQSGVCTFCNNLLKGCSICSSSTVCTECAEGYLLSGTACTSCSSLISGCLSCNGTSVCLSCLDQYYLSASNTCNKCNSVISGCSECNSSSVCLSCMTNYYKNSTNFCLQCNDVMCLSCSTAAICFNCLSGYFVNSTGNCQQCSNSFSGCVLCNSSFCLQCVSGFYLNSSKQCSKCMVNGCQICNQVSPLQCATCSSLYYLNSTNNCVSCPLSMEGCLNCLSSTYCIKCQNGFYLASNFTCQPCFGLFKGCKECSATSCSACQGGFLMSGSTCATCISLIAGCQYCTSSTVCLTCQSGYYAANNVCLSCTNITGCLDCSSGSSCNLCSDQYYLELTDKHCYSCSVAIVGCVTCSSSSTCKSCQGNYGLSGGICTVLKSETTQAYQELRMETEYINSSCLLHRLIARGAAYASAAINLTQSTVITMVGINSSLQLDILSFSWPSNKYQIDFYTNNPLGGNFSSLFKPIPSARLLQDVVAQKGRDRLLVNSNINLNYQFKLDMTESAIQAILPSSVHSGSLSLKSKADDPTFIRSIYSQVTYNYHNFGLIVTILLLVIYFIKAAVTVPNSDDQGEIISHIFLLKCGGFIFGLAYMEYLDYCYGFLSADLPWLSNFTLSLSSISDLSPNSYLLFFANMTLASTYLGALCLVALIAVILIVIGVVSSAKRESVKIVGMFFYNFFEVGLIIAGSASIQGAYYNSINYVTTNTIFYILGILLYLLVGIANIWLAVTNIHRINKLRILLKATFLSLLYISPIYFLPIAMGVEVIFIVIEFQIKKATKLHPHVWFINQILVNLSFVFLVLLSDSLLSIVLSMAFASAAILIDFFIHIREFRHQEQIIKVKEIQKLTSMLETQEKLNRKIKKRNNTIYENIKKGDTLSNSDDFTQPTFYKQFENDILNSDSTFLQNPKKQSEAPKLYTLEDELSSN